MEGLGKKLTASSRFVTIIYNKLIALGLFARAFDFLSRNLFVCSCVAWGKRGFFFWYDPTYGFYRGVQIRREGKKFTIKRQVTYDLMRCMWSRGGRATVLNAKTLIQLFWNDRKSHQHQAWIN